MESERYADRLIEAAIERGEFASVRGSGEPIPDLCDDPAWWVRSLLEREELPHRRRAVAQSVQARIDEAVACPSLIEARRALEAANAIVRRWNAAHQERDHLEEQSDLWLISERARRPE